MKNKKSLSIIIMMLYGMIFTVFAQKGRITENFDFGWKFHMGEVHEAITVSYDDNGWESIQLPHDFSITQKQENDRRLSPNGYFPGGIGWYRKTFSIPKNYEGKKVFICFDGVYHRSDVWLNGQHVGFYPYGYVSFEYDLTPYLRMGENNVLAVRVDHSNAPTSRWYSGSGIYRHVRLNILDEVHVDTWGVSITTPQISTAEGEVQIETTVRNESKGSANVLLTNDIYSPEGEKVGSASQTVNIYSGKSVNIRQSITIKQPLFWNLENTALYTAMTKINADSYTDEIRTSFGFRTLDWDAQKGFSLNGEILKLKGVNLHHDGGISVGVAVPERIWEMRLTRLKEIGVNFIRTSHNPPAPEFLDLCDRIGLFVLDEFFDKWKSGYYDTYYDEWWRIDLLMTLKRDRNHPSVILWSVGNEVREQGILEGAERLQTMVEFVHENEPTRKVTAGLYPDESNHNVYGFADKLDIVGHNYNEPYYVNDKEKYPHRILLGTENYLYYRGLAGNAMHFETEKHTWRDVLEHDWVVGWALWAGIDYIGETSRFNLKGWPTGIIDASGREKTIAGLYRAFWKEEPQLEIAVLDDALDIDPGSVNWSSPKMIGHWNFPHYQNQLIRVHTFSNCDSVELQINQRSLGARAVGLWSNQTVAWMVPYAEGILKATGYKNGEAIITKELHTAGDPTHIVLKSIYSSVQADGQDVALIEISLIDANGLPVQHDDRSISVTVEGPGVFVGLDNGDLRMREPIGTNRLSTWFGHCLLVVRSTQKPGDILVTVKSEGLTDALLTISSR